MQGLKAQSAQACIISERSSQSTQLQLIYEIPTKVTSFHSLATRGKHWASLHLLKRSGMFSSPNWQTCSMCFLPASHPLSLFGFPHWNPNSNHFKSMFSCIFYSFHPPTPNSCLCMLTQAYILRKRYIKMGKLAGPSREILTSRMNARNPVANSTGSSYVVQLTMCSPSLKEWTLWAKRAIEQEIRSLQR